MIKCYLHLGISSYFFFKNCIILSKKEMRFVWHDLTFYPIFHISAFTWLWLLHLFKALKLWTVPKPKSNPVVLLCLFRNRNNFWYLPITQYHSGIQRLIENPYQFLLAHNTGFLFPQIKKSMVLGCWLFFFILPHWWKFLLIYHSHWVHCRCPLCVIILISI